MGVCCEAAQATRTDEGQGFADLPEPRLNRVTDRIEKLEKSMPWQRTYFKSYLNDLTQAKDDTD